MVPCYQLGFLLFSILMAVSSASSSPPPNSPTVFFSQGFYPLYGNQNVIPYGDDRSVQISMDLRSSSGFASKEIFLHGYFSSTIKLPENYTAGVVVTFYASNGQIFPSNHDEIDFEFLGRVQGQDWVVQTNMYGGGSTARGREERYVLWFDPSKGFHRYAVLWTEDRIIFYVDDVPIREVQKVAAMGGDWPAKPMNFIGTIWNGSDWATNGGRDKLNMAYGPYIAKYSDFVLNGCPADQIKFTPQCEKNPGFATIPVGITAAERTKMKSFRRKYMRYSYCHDRARYKVPLPECALDRKEEARRRSFM
ncbi:hypothetical protein RJ640_025821 [Escallonia rubra]|uniref:Xyloglucan endotransglucosylase/hydrolase n=1 Tax=Escallonia rubra TaxID=112253 RepID=A0AA88U3D7_9ASTE|nr:hypothetical protein RJ640_025821 [Escallonia rubra]